MADHRLAHRTDRRVDAGQSRELSIGIRWWSVLEVLRDQVGVLELVAGLAARGVEADAERLQACCPASASSATTSEESIPPESSTPTGTSATIRRSTAVRSEVEQRLLPVPLGPVGAVRVTAEPGSQ